MIPKVQMSNAFFDNYEKIVDLKDRTKITFFVFMIRVILILIFSFIAYSGVAQAKRPVIAFTSDTQQPMWEEKLIRKSNHNQKATEMIFKDVQTVRASGLFILGDV